MAFDPNNPNGSATSANSQPVVIASDQAAVPVTATSLPLPTGAAADTSVATTNTEIGGLTDTAPATDTASASLNGRLQRIAQRLSTLISGGLAVTGTFWQATQPVSGTFWQTTQPVSAASLPLPTGAATAAKQPALGTAGTPSADVLSVQGATSMTPIKVDGSGVTQPVSLASVPSHPVTNAGTFAVQSTEADGANTTQGSKADAKNSATDTTAITIMSVLKQISFSIQAAATSLAGTLSVATHAVTQSGTWTVQIGNTPNTTAIKVDGSAVTQPVSIATAPALVASSAIIGKVGIDQTTPGTTNGVQVNAALPAGTNLMGKVGIDQTTPGSTNAVTPVPATSGGPSEARVMSAASTNATSTKASAGQLYGWYFYNNTASVKFVKFYNKASSPTVGTDTPARTLAIPPNSGSNVEFSMGIPMGTGIAYAITGGIADSDTTAVALNDVTGFFLYK